MCLRLESSTYTLHQTPSLKLYGQVDPSATRVAVLARGITITLGNQRNLFYAELSRQKFGWIKKDPNAALDNDSDFEPAAAGLPEPGFISPYLTQAGQGRARGTTPSLGRRSSLRQCGCPVTRSLRRRSWAISMPRLWRSILTFCDQVLSESSL